MQLSSLQIATLKKRLAGLADAVFLNTGQVCLCAERVYVERQIFAAFVDALKKKAEEMHPGWPTDARTDLGPLISAQHREKVLSYYRLALEEGATLVTGGGVPVFGDDSRQGLLRATNHLYWTVGISALRERRNLWAGVPRRTV